MTAAEGEAKVNEPAAMQTPGQAWTKQMQESADTGAALYAAHKEVNHPAHYQHPSGVEAVTICEHENFCRGNVIKYVMRAGKKPGENELTDLRKALWYLTREVRRLEQESGQ